MPVPVVIYEPADGETPRHPLSAFALLCHTAVAFTVAVELLAERRILDPLFVILSWPLSIFGFFVAAPVALAAGLIEVAVRRGRTPVVVSTALLATLVWHYLFSGLALLPPSALRVAVLTYCAYSLCLGAFTLTRFFRDRWNR